MADLRVTDDGPGEARSSVVDRVVQKRYLYAFVLVTSLFALWGFANDITNPMVAAFKNALLLSNFESSLVQSAFYGGYCAMAIPAAIFIRRYSYKSGILVGLVLYAAGCLLFLPAAGRQDFAPFLLAYFVMTCGLSFLETTANPYILSMGSKQTATQRLNLAQAFNPMGSLLGMFVAMQLILARLDTATEDQRRELSVSEPARYESIVEGDLKVIAGPYLALGLVVAAVFVLFLLSKFPRSGESSSRMELLPAIFRLAKRPVYYWGVVAQAFYVGAQIMCWTFIIQYAAETLGMEKAEAQGYNIVAMAIFVLSRFICTFALKYLRPGLLLSALAAGGGALSLGTILLPGFLGLWCLVGISACMSLMFPTIYGLALDDLGEDAKLGSAGLIMAIGGGSLMPPLQAMIIDSDGILGLSGARASFALPLACFLVIACYGGRVSKLTREREAS